jgi:hypothetical protein
MSKLIRLDQSGHTTLAEWSTEQPAGYEAAVIAFKAELERGFFGIVAHRDGTAEMITELGFDAPTVILRRPIAGG